MKAQLFKQIKINISFTDEEIELITQVMLKSEYKHEVDNEGYWGTYVRVRNIFSQSGQEHFRELSFREIDKILKALEIYTRWGIEKGEDGWDLSRKLSAVLVQTNLLSSENLGGVDVKF